MKIQERISTTVYLIGFFFLALVVRVVHLVDTDIAGDEPFSIFIAQFGVSCIIEFLSTGNNPPLFEILLHYYMKLFGNDNYSLRLLPMLFSSATVIPLFLLGARFFNLRIAITSSALFVFALQHIQFAHEVRVYSFLVLMTAWSLYFFLSSLNHPDRKLNWLGLFCCNLILIYSHFTSFYFLAVQFTLALAWIKREHFKLLISTFLLITIGYLPYAFTFLNRLADVGDSGTWVIKPSFGEIYGSVNLMLNQRWSTVAVIIAFSVGVALSFKRDGTKALLNQFVKHKTGMLVSLMFIIPYLLMFVVSYFFIPMFIDRYLLFNSIALFITVAFIIDTAWQDSSIGWVGPLLVIVAVIFTTNLNPTNHRSIKAATEFVKETRDASSAVFICPNHFNLGFLYHYDRNLFFSVDTEAATDPIELANSVLKEQSIYPTKFIEESDLKEFNSVLYFDADSKFVLPDNRNLEILKSEFSQAQLKHFPEIFDVYSFVRVSESD